MTLTALRGRLYLFGGSGTAAKCFQDLQILDRHEMAWLDVMPDTDDQNSGVSGSGSISHDNSNVGQNLDNRFQFGGRKMYGTGGLLYSDDTVPRNHQANAELGVSHEWRTNRDSTTRQRLNSSSNVSVPYASPNPNDEDTVTKFSS